MRLFIAVNFLPQALDAFCRRQAALRQAGIQGNFSRRENLHLTLAFLGEVPQQRVPEVRRCMDAAAGAPFALEIGRPGRFRGSQGDTLWLAVHAPQALYDLQGRLAAALRRTGFVLENRPFTPHLTLARRAAAPAGFAWDAVRCAPVSCSVQALSLMCSERVGGVLTYTELYRRELDGDGTQKQSGAGRDC